MNFYIPLAAFLGLIAAGGLTDIILHPKKRNWVVTALNIALWACFGYVLYLIIGA